jgi:hypothetical protein
MVGCIKGWIEHLDVTKALERGRAELIATGDDRVTKAIEADIQLSMISLQNKHLHYNEYHTRMRRGCNITRCVVSATRGGKKD